MTKLSEEELARMEPSPRMKSVSVPVEVQRALLAEIREHRAALRQHDSKWGSTIGGVARIPHEAIEDFVQRAQAHVDELDDNGRATLATCLLDDAVTNLRQLLAEHRAAQLTDEEREALAELRGDDDMACLAIQACGLCAKCVAGRAIDKLIGGAG